MYFFLKCSDKSVCLDILSEKVFYSLFPSQLSFLWLLGKVLNGKLERKVISNVQQQTHTYLLGRNMEWVAISYSRGSPHLGNQTCVSCIPCIGRQIFTAVPAAWEAPVCSICFLTKSMNMPEPKLFYVVISSLSCFPFEIVKAKIFFFSFLNFLVHFKKHI